MGTPPFPSILPGNHAHRAMMYGRLYWRTRGTKTGYIAIANNKWFSQNQDQKKKKKREILDISIVGTSSFSLARLTTVFALVFHFFFSPSLHLSFPSPQSLYISFADHLWKLTPRRRKGRHWAESASVILPKFTNLGVHLRRIIPRRRDENRGGEAGRNSHLGNDPKPICQLLSLYSQPRLTSFHI